MKTLISLFGILLLTGVCAQEKITEVDINKYLNTNVKYCDKVYSTYKSANVILLNLGDKYPKQKLTVPIFKEDWHKFEYRPEEYLNNKIICITGELTLYKDTPQVVARKPEAIEIGR